MAKKGSFSKVYDKNGDHVDVEAVRFDGTRTFQMQGDVTASQTWNGDPSSPLTLNTSIGAKKVTQYNIADKAVGTGQMADGSVGLTQMAASAMTDTVSANNSKLVTSQGVNAAIAAATLNRGKDYGPMSVDEINAISETIPTGSTVYVESLGASDAKVINDGYSDGTMASFSVEVGEDLKYYRSPDNSLHGWYSTEANVKIKQPANYAGGIAVDSAQDASSGSAGIEFIQSFKQNTNGNISDIVKARVDLVDSTSSTRTDAAATPNSVKSAYDLANGKYSKPSGGIPKTDLESDAQTSLGKADTAIQGVKVNNTTLTPDANKVVTVPLATASADGAMSAADKAKLNDIEAGAEANVQADWNQTDTTADDFIKNKPYFIKYVEDETIYKVCTLQKYTDTSTNSSGIELFYRRGAGAVHGKILHKSATVLYLDRIGDVSTNYNTIRWYYSEISGGLIQIFAKQQAYCRLSAAPLANMPKSEVNFDSFGTVVSALPEGATEITPVWVANSASSSGTAPVKVDAYGALTPVPMDSTPTASSTNLMTSGAIRDYLYKNVWTPATSGYGGYKQGLLSFVIPSGSAGENGVKLHLVAYLAEDNQFGFTRYYIAAKWRQDGTIVDGSIEVMYEKAFNPTNDNTKGKVLWSYDSSTSTIKVGVQAYAFAPTIKMHVVDCRAIWGNNIAWTSLVGTEANFANTIIPTSNATIATAGIAVGSASVPVYAAANGHITPCTDDFVHDGDVTSTYSPAGTDPVNGTAVAQAVAESYVATVYAGGSTKSFKVIEFDLAGSTAANCLLGILEVQAGGFTCQCMFDINAVYTVSSHTVGTVVSELCWIKSKTNNIKLAYSIDTNTDKLIIYVKNLNSWYAAQVRVLTAQVEGRNNLGYMTMFNSTSVTLPDSAVEFTELNSRDASWITSGTFGTPLIADDAITAAKVKDNETLPVNISGLSANATNWSGQISGVANSVSTKRYVYIGRKLKSTYGCLIGMLTICSHTDSKDVYVIGSGWSSGNFGDDATVQRISSGRTDAPIKICLYNHEVTENGTTYSELWCYIPTNSGEVDFAFRQLFNYNSKVTFPTGVVNRAESAFTGTLTKCANSDSRNIAFSPTNTAKGSTSVPVYVKASGEIAACTDTFVNNIAYVANQSGGGGNLNKTINGTTTSVLTFMNDAEAVAIWADAKTAAANAS